MLRKIIQEEIMNVLEEMLGEEDLHEISKETLGRYIKKAGASYADAGYSIGRARANKDEGGKFTNTNDMSYELKNKIRDMVDQHFNSKERDAQRIAKKRVTGIDRAVKRLVK